MNYLNLTYNEMEGRFELFMAMADGRKSHRTAIALHVMAQPTEVVKRLRDLADELERKFE